MSRIALPRIFDHPRPDNHILAFRQGVAVTFGQFRANAAGVADRMTGCKSAALICRDSYGFAVGLFGLMLAGSKVVLPPNSQPGTLAALSCQFEHLLDDRLLDAPPGSPRDVGLDADGLGIDFFTSGSTGQAKRVTRTLGMLEREIAVYDTLWTAAPTVATVTPQHLYGLTFRLLWPLASGQPFAAETHEVWETLLPVFPPGATLVASPAHLGRMAGLAPLSPPSCPGLVLSAGAPLSAAAAQEAAAILGCVPTEIFGSTETGAFASRRQYADNDAWQLFPGNKIDTDPEGRLALNSPYGDGWQQTEDRVEQRRDGFVFCGRADQLVKIEGKRISLSEIEAALTRSPWVEAAAALLLPGDPPRLAAVVVPSRQGRERLAAVGGFRFGRLLRSGLAETQDPTGMPRQWRFLDALPTGALGKRNQSALLALFAKTP